MHGHTFRAGENFLLSITLWIPITAVNNAKLGSGGAEILYLEIQILLYQFRVYLRSVRTHQEERKQKELARTRNGSVVKKKTDTSNGSSGDDSTMLDSASIGIEEWIIGNY